MDQFVFCRDCRGIGSLILDPGVYGSFFVSLIKWQQGHSAVKWVRSDFDYD